MKKNKALGLIAVTTFGLVACQNANTDKNQVLESSEESPVLVFNEQNDSETGENQEKQLLLSNGEVVKEIKSTYYKSDLFSLSADNPYWQRTALSKEIVEFAKELYENNTESNESDKMEDKIKLDSIADEKETIKN